MPFDVKGLALLTKGRAGLSTILKELISSYGLTLEWVCHAQPTHLPSSVNVTASHVSDKEL